MSLINDALKRAKQHRSPTRPGDAASPAMRPVERGAHSGSGPMTVAVVLIVLVLLGAGLLFYLAGRNAALSSNYRPPPAPQTSDSPPRAPSSPTRPATDPVVAPTPVPAVPTPVTTSALPAPPVTNPSTVPTPATSAPPTAAPVPPVVVTPPPAPLIKLQGIFYRLNNPSAMINGKTVFVGDRIADGKVVAIDQSSVTIVQSGKTNVLSLE